MFTELVPASPLLPPLPVYQPVPPARAHYIHGHRQHIQMRSLDGEGLRTLQPQEQFNSKQGPSRAVGMGGGEDPKSPQWESSPGFSQPIPDAFIQSIQLIALQAAPFENVDHSRLHTAERQKHIPVRRSDSRDQTFKQPTGKVTEGLGSLGHPRSYLLSLSLMSHKYKVLRRVRQKNSRQV